MTTGPSVDSRQWRVAFASCMGTTIEFYDFYIYATAASLVFPKVFFPALGAVAGSVASLSTFAVAFLARPLGAVVFGHYGDRIGRKRTLTVTLLMMGLGTMLIGVLPTSATIGALAPAILVLLRIVQGLAIGGEWAGAALLAAEYAPTRKRGFYTIFPQLGSSLGYGLSCISFIATVLLVGESDTFLRIGWRIPFLLSGILIIIGLYLRLKIEETPVFRAELDRLENEVEARAGQRRAPLLSVFTSQPRELLVGTGTQLSVFAFFFIGVTYLSAYAIKPTAEGGMGLTRFDAFTVGLVASPFFVAATIVSGVLSDRLGRRRTTQIALVIGAAWSLAIFPILQSGSLPAFGVVMTGTLIVVGLQVGYLAALVPELFHTEHRYTGAAVSYNVAAIVGGAVPPLLAAPLAASFGTSSIGLMLLGFSLVSLVCSLGLPRFSPLELNATAVSRSLTGRKLGSRSK